MPKIAEDLSKPLASLVTAYRTLGCPLPQLLALTGSTRGMADVKRGHEAMATFLTPPPFRTEGTCGKFHQNRHPPISQVYMSYSHNGIIYLTWRMHRMLQGECP